MQQEYIKSLVMRPYWTQPLLVQTARPFASAKALAYTHMLSVYLPDLVSDKGYDDGMPFPLRGVFFWSSMHHMHHMVIRGDKRLNELISRHFEFRLRMHTVPKIAAIASRGTE